MPPKGSKKKKAVVNATVEGQEVEQGPSSVAENEPPQAPEADPNGRPIRSTRGLGGVNARQEKTSNIIFIDFEKAGKRKSRAANVDTSAMPENEMAPPLKKPRNGVTVVSHVGPPIQMQPRPTPSVAPWDVQQVQPSPRQSQGAPPPVQIQRAAQRNQEHSELDHAVQRPTAPIQRPAAPVQQPAHPVPRPVQHAAHPVPRPVQHAANPVQRYAAPAAENSVQYYDAPVQQPVHPVTQHAPIQQPVHPAAYNAHQEASISHQDEEEQQDYEGIEQEEDEEEEEGDSDGERRSEEASGDECMQGIDEENIGDEEALQYVDGDEGYDDAGQDDEEPAAQLVDEVSDDEEERRARALLRQPSPHVVEVEDVLQEHRRRNRANKPPRPEALRKAAVSQGAVSQGLTRENNEASDDDEVLGEAHIAHKKSSTSSAREVSKHSVASFTGYWKDVLKIARKLMCLYVVEEVPFPTRENHLLVADGCVKMAVTVFERMNTDKVLPDKKKTLLDRNTAVTAFVYASTFRGRLKTMIRPLVKNAYGLEVPSEVIAANPNMFENQMGEIEYIKDRVAYWLLNGKYHRGVAKTRYHDVPFGHPFVKKICLDFFYHPTKGVAVPIKGLETKTDFFKTSLPHKAFALVASCIHNCLEEWRDGIDPARGGPCSGIEFKGEEYSLRYDACMLVAAEAEKDTLNQGPRLARLCREVAEEGCAIMRPTKNPPNPYRMTLHSIPQEELDYGPEG
ncbi:hypothetical protein JR316_0013411 [Psilocybe cubensis]|uniref:DUF6532 domain-containing protein n=2 Tax=Psilocybe cubensis TaxID=181762 RepID=A0A8H7XIT4_PSICU|nr:uncharacterized protein JR316_0013411 [Psilocybe cubensis]KAH9474248.1 hypothetical protein JR316_0013411 [Psilocybe cubensis]